MAIFKVTALEPPKICSRLFLAFPSLGIGIASTHFPTLFSSDDFDTSTREANLWVGIISKVSLWREKCSKVNPKSLFRGKNRCVQVWKYKVKLKDLTEVIARTLS
jgi:hypothetical protein